eukprot:TRINITY_DN26813_c0_g1_i1.p1 TRINITY_DN26813_c0_g1~~TRINITY_DN26813_c0_g1_i1.p1  ORF type:complete len:287 (-),score=56.35 TRINITY_DN26813_c0_g1_i1:225-1085(-)
MADQEKKGDTLVQQAEKKLKGWAFFGGKYDEAAELLEKAATSYKVAKAWDKAADTYRRVSELQLKHLDSSHEAASALIEASNCLKKTNPNSAKTCLKEAIDLFVDNGRLSMAARHCKDLAEMYEKDEDVDNAVEWFGKAADFYQTENANTSVNQMRLKVAEFSALKADYPTAIEIYESVAKDSLSSNLLKYSVKNYLLNAGLCQLCRNDTVAVQNALDKYNEMDPSFGDTREYKLLNSLAQAAEEGNADGFTEAIKEFDNITRLDSWKTTLLLRAKQAIQEEEPLT